MAVKVGAILHAVYTPQGTYRGKPVIYYHYVYWPERKTHSYPYENPADFVEISDHNQASFMHTSEGIADLPAAWQPEPCNG